MSHWKKEKVDTSDNGRVHMWEWEATKFLFYEITLNRQGAVLGPYKCCCYLGESEYREWSPQEAPTLQQAKRKCEKHFRELAGDIEDVNHTTR